MNKPVTPVKKLKLSPTEAKVVKAKIKAELTDTSQSKVAQEIFPNQTPGAAAVTMTRQLKKANVQEALEIALAEHDLTADRLALVVDEAMSASKKEYEKNDDGSWELVGETPEHSIRLKAAGMAANWMGVGKQSEQIPQSVHFHNHQVKENGEYGL